MKKMIISPNAPAAIGPYSQAIKVGSLVFLSGQIALAPGSAEIIAGDFKARVRQIFSNIKAITQEAGGSLAHIVKLTVYLTEMSNFVSVNEIMMECFTEPYPARTTVTVTALPKATDVEIEAIMVSNI